MGQRSRAGQTCWTLFYPGAPAPPAASAPGGVLCCHLAKREYFSHAFLCGPCGLRLLRDPARPVPSCCRRRTQKPSRLARRKSMKPKAAPPPSVWRVSWATTNMALLCWRLRTSQNRHWMLLTQRSRSCRQALSSPTVCSGRWPSGIAPPPISNWTSGSKAAGDLGTAEATLTKAIAAAVGNAPLAQHLTQLRQGVRAQRADVLERLGKHSEAQSIRATQ